MECQTGNLLLINYLNHFVDRLLFSIDTLVFGPVSLLKNQIDSADQQKKCRHMIPFERKVLEEDQRKARKDYQRDHLLDDLQLDKAEWAALLLEADPIGGHLKTIFEEGYPPADQDNREQGRMPGAVLPKKTQMPVPGHRHKRIGKDQQPDGQKDGLHMLCFAAK